MFLKRFFLFIWSSYGDFIRSFGSSQGDGNLTIIHGDRKKTKHLPLQKTITCAETHQTEHQHLTQINNTQRLF